MYYIIHSSIAFPLTAILASVVPIGTILVVVLVGLIVVGMYFAIKKLKKAGKFSFKNIEEGKGRRQKRRRKKRHIELV